MRKITYIIATAILAGAGAYALQRSNTVDFAALLAFGAAKPVAAQTPAAPRPRVPVETARARAETTTRDIRSVGSLQSDESVQVASEIGGRVSEIRFTEGQSVKAGDVLVQLDDAVARAVLAELEARLKFAQANFDRAQTLSKTGAVSERAHDEAIVNLGTATAAIDLQRVNLGKHNIYAPFDGVVGLRTISVGAYVNVGAALVNLEKIDRLKLDFKVPETFLGQVNVGQAVDIEVDARPGRLFTASVYAMDPMVDVNGRSLRLRAHIANDGLDLRPGLFARVTVKGQARQNVVMVPESAIVPRGQEKFLFVVEDGKAAEHKVTLGERKAGEVEILTGLTANDVVVTAGQTRLRNGVTVEVVDTSAPAPQG